MKTSRHLVAFGALALVTLTGGQALAQVAVAGPPPPTMMEPAPEPESGAGGARTHDGFYMQLAAGLGYMSSTYDYGAAGFGELSVSGVTFPSSLLLGGSPIPGLVIGGGFIWDYSFSPSAEQAGVTGDLQGVTQMLIGIGPFVDIYPDPGGGLHFQGLVGFGGLETSYEGDVGGNDPTGLVLALGAGYEWWMADEWSIGVMGRFTYGALSYQEVSVPTIAPAVLATFTYH